MAEFPIVRRSDATHMARRTRILGALASLAEKQRNVLARAVTEACRLVAAQGVPAVARLGIAELDRQSLVEVTVACVADASDTAEYVTDKSSLDKLEKIGSSLTEFELSNFPGSSTKIVLGQAAPSLVRVSQHDVAHWRELLTAETPEDAIAIAQQGRQQSEAELDIARSHGPTLEAAQQSASDREDLETLSLVASRATNAVLIMDADGSIQWTNDAFAAQTGYSNAEVFGERLDKVLFGADTDPKAVRDFQQALRNGHEITEDVQQYHRDGRTYWVECKLIPIHDTDGKLSRWIGIQSDVTRRRQTEEALRAAKQAAETSSRTKSEFLANMSHEIRTPLNAILGMAELALTTDLSPEQRDYLRTVRSSADTLLQLLNDVLDISKIEAGKMEIEEVDFSLPDVIRETTKALAVKAHEKGLELSVHMPMDITQYLRGDPTRIRQVLFNLVGNAIKFTDRGEVAVEVEEQWRTDEDVGLHFSVRDTGIGIPKDRLQQIFESFTQVDSSTTRRFGGSGLGLTITSQLLRLMNGKIWVQSKQGKGSTFHFTIQLKIGQQPTDASSTHMDAGTLAGKSVLVVDDNATNRRILEEMLRHWRMRPTLATGAPDALKQLEKASRSNEPFDVVLLDAMMPQVDGFGLAEKIQSRPDISCGTVMMLSSADRPSSAARCRELGIRAHLVKPITASTLLETILTALSQDVTQGRAKRPAAPLDEELAARPEPKRSLRVLVVDDHEPNRNLAIKILERRGHACIPATDGDEAISACAQDAFDAVLMDVQMPGRDGLSATREIRLQQERSGSQFPIIALTAHALSSDREKCLAAGMDAYLAKPIHARELVALVERITGAAPEKGHNGAPSSPPTDSQPFDISAALARMDGEWDLLREYIRDVVDDIPQLIDGLWAAIEDGDARSLQMSAHRLKSLVSSYDHSEARQLAQTLEDMGKDGEINDARTTMNRLQLLVDELVRALSKHLQEEK